MISKLDGTEMIGGNLPQGKDWSVYKVKTSALPLQQCHECCSLSLVMREITSGVEAATLEVNPSSVSAKPMARCASGLIERTILLRIHFHS